MNVEVILTHSKTKQVFDITSLTRDIQVESFLYDQPARFTATVEKDPNGLLNMVNGSMIQFRVDGEPFFKGFVFRLGTNAKEAYGVTAFDQMHYLKNTVTLTTTKMSASQIFAKVCGDANLAFQVKQGSGFVCPDHVHSNKSRYNVIKYGIDQALIGENKSYFVKDKGGVLIFTELEAEKTNLIIGHESLLEDYDYTLSIEEAVNSVKVVKEGKKGKKEIYTEDDPNTQAEWGKLEHVESIDSKANSAQARALAKEILALKNKETKTMSLNALGRKEIVAGSGFVLDLPDLDIKESMWVTSARHSFQNDLHRMDLEVAI